MAEGKNKIIVYRDWISTFEALSDAQAGRLIKHFFRYVNDQSPEAPDKITQIAFVQIEETLKRDLKNWEKKKETNSDSGLMGNLKRWHIDLYDKVVKRQLDLEEAISIAKDRERDKTRQTTSRNIAVTDSDKVTVTDKDINTHTPAREEGNLKESPEWVIYIENPQLHSIFDLKKFMAENFQSAWEQMQMHHGEKFEELFSEFLLKNNQKSYRDNQDLRSHLIHALNYYQRNGKSNIQKNNRKSSSATQSLPTWNIGSTP